MNRFGGRSEGLVIRLYECLLQLYPDGFRNEFSDEIREVIANRLRDAQAQGKAAWFTAVLQEVSQLIVSILREGWHAFRVRKGKPMLPEDRLHESADIKEVGMLLPQPARPPGAVWIAGWTLLVTAAIPAAYIAMAPLTVIFLWLVDLGAKVGLWPPSRPSTLEGIGLIFSLALMLAAVQWFLLRRWLPKAGLWFLATVAGGLLGALPVSMVLSTSTVQSWDPLWITAAALLPLGLILGVAQWSYLRRFLPKAFWIILIDFLAAGSILLIGRSITSLFGLLIFLLPGAITGLGMWRLLGQSHPGFQPQPRTATGQKHRRWLFRLTRVGIGGVALIALYFLGIWVYASSQLTLAKSKGIYPTVEEAVIAYNSQGFGGARVVRIENVHAGPNSRTGPSFVWFGGATLYLDRSPQGYSMDHFSSGSYYFHIKDGWILVPEGAFPDFIAWVMQLYNLEGVNP